MQKIVLRKSKFFDKTNNIKLFKGEKNADYLQILIPTIYNNIELTECNVRLTYITPDNNEHSFLIDEYKQDGFYKDTYISYLINIEERFTSLVGEISLYITITDSNENVVLKSDTTYLTIDEHPKGENGITPEEIEIIDQVVLISNEAKQNSLDALDKSSEALENSEEAKQIAQSVRDDADNGVFDGEDGYTPVKGVDYFTEQEIEEIEQGAAEKVDLSNYVEKEQGKGLSSNDYTSEEKDKLAGLSNYDDTQIRNDLENKIDKVQGKGLSTNDYSDAEKKKVSDIIGCKKNNVVLDLGTIEQGNFGGQNEDLSNAQVCRTSLLEVDLNTKLNISLPENIKYVIFYGDTPTYSANNQLRQLNSTWTDDATANISSKYIRIKFAAYDGGGNRINITPDMLEDVEITYDSFEAIPSHIYEDKVVRVASNTATDIEKQYADLICDGVGDEAEINQGLQFLASIGGGTLELSSGTFFLDNFTVGSDGVYRAIQFPNVDGVTISIKGKGGMVKDNLVGTCIDLSYAAYTALDNTSNNQYELFGQDVTTTLSATVLYMSDLMFRSPSNQKKFIFIDLYNFGRVELTHVYVRAFKNTQGSNISPAIEGLIGIRMLRGSNFGTENNYLSCGMNGCYEGWQVGSEHVYMRQCSAIYNVYGYTFGNYEWTNAFLHPITMIKCTDERNVNLPLFKKCGFYSGSVNKGQRISMIDFSIERKTDGTPGRTLGNLAVEETDGTFNGEITFTMLNNSNINCVDVSFFQSGGSNFKIRNSAQKLYGTNTLRDSYAANQWQGFYSTDNSCLYRYVNGQWVKDYDDTYLKNAIDAINDTLYPRITKQPDDVVGLLTAGRDISITAIGTNLTYQWQFSNDNGATWKNSSATGYNTNTLSIVIGNLDYNGRLYRCKVTDGNGTVIYSDTCQCIVYGTKATTAQIKSGAEQVKTIVPNNLDAGVFYGLAKAAGDTTQASSSNPVGTYTDEAKGAIQQMIGILSSEGVGF